MRGIQLHIKLFCFFFSQSTKDLNCPQKDTVPQLHLAANASKIENTETDGKAQQNYSSFQNDEKEQKLLKQ